MKSPLAGLMQQAQKMQEGLQKAQQEMAAMEVTGEAGGGMVKVVMAGNHEVRSVAIDRQLLSDDAEMVEDLLAAACNDAVNRIAEASQDRFKGLTGGLDLPAGFKLPF